MGALGAIYLASLLLAAAIVVVVCVVGGTILAIGLRALHREGANLAAPTRTACRLSNGLVVVAAVVAAVPLIATLLARATIGQDSVPSDTETVATVALGLGALSVAAAWMARHRAARAATAGLLVAVIVVPAAIQLWVTSQTVGYASRYRANQELALARATRYADLIDGPSVGEIVAGVGSVGTWRPVSGSFYPFLRSDEWTGDQGPVADLSGRTIRVVVFAQCWVEGDAGGLLTYVHDFDVGTLWQGSGGRCDGTMQVLAPDPIQLRVWPADRLAAARAHDRDLIAVNTVPLTTEGRNPTEYALRSVVYVSPDPGSSLEDLTKAVTAAAGSFEIR